MTTEHFAATDPWAPEVLAELAGVVDEWYDDVLALLVRGYGGHQQVTGARLAHITADAIEITARAGDDDARVRIDLGEPMARPDDLYDRLAAAIAHARSTLPDVPPTSLERQRAEAAGIRTFLTTVVEVVDIHPHLREITFGGGDLEAFTPLGADTYLHLLVPPAGRRELTIGRDFSWDAVREMPADERPGGAYYTVRRWDSASQRLTMHFVLHGDEGSGSAWAQRAEVGSPVALWGPRRAFDPPEDTEWLLLVADETALPATAVILEQMPAGRRAVVFAEVADDTEHQSLPTSPLVEITWLHRDGAAPGTTTLLEDAVKAMPWPGGRVYAWGGGESHALSAIRRYLRREIGLPQSAVSMSGYRRRSATGH